MDIAKPTSLSAVASLPKARLLDMFSVDVRSLALFRIGLGVVLLIDLFTRMGDFQSMYTDDGMFSRAVICRHLTSVWNWSLHFGSGSWGYQAFLFVLAAVLAMALLVGYETRLATIGSWLMLISIHNRVPPVLAGGDNLLCLLLFWGMFLPLGHLWSVDRLLRRKRSSARVSLAPVLSMASAGVLLQMGMMYLFSAISKSNADWWSGGAVAGALAHDMYAKPLGDWLLKFPRFLSMATFAVLAVEWIAPIFLFMSKHFVVRMLAISCLAAMHVGIAMTLSVGTFSVISLVGLTLFIPGGFWVLLRMGSGEAASGAEGGGRLPRAAHYCCVAALSYIVLVNLNGLSGQPLAFLKLDRWPMWTGLGLSQRWGMFERVPSKDGWYVADGRLADGSQVDILNGGRAVDWSRPEVPLDAYPNHRWQKCFREMSYADGFGYQVFRQPVAEYLFRTWNERNPERALTALNLTFCMESEDSSGAPSREILAQVEPSAGS